MKKKILFSVVGGAVIALTTGSFALAADGEFVEMRQEHIEERAELRQEQREEFQEMRQENIEERREKREERREEIKEKVQENVINALERRSDRFAAKVDRMSEKLDNIIERLNEAGADTSSLPNLVDSLEDKADVVIDKYSAYEDAVDTGDKDAIQDARSALWSARDDFRDYYRETLRPAIKSIVEDLRNL